MGTPAAVAGPAPPDSEGSVAPFTTAVSVHRTRNGTRQLSRGAWTRLQPVASSRDEMAELAAVAPSSAMQLAPAADAAPQHADPAAAHAQPASDRQPGQGSAGAAADTYVAASLTGASAGVNLQPIPTVLTKLGKSTARACHMFTASAGTRAPLLPLTYRQGPACLAPEPVTLLNSARCCCLQTSGATMSRAPPRRSTPRASYP